MGVMLVRLDEGARVVGFDRVDDGGQPAPVGDADAARGGASATDGDDDA